MDLSDTIIPKSDQLNAEDLLTGPRTFTVSDVRKGSGEQPVDIHLTENPGRPFRPSKTVRRILVAAWGPDANTYTGRRMTLYRDPEVRWAGQAVGGIRVSHLSHIDKPFTLALAETKSKRTTYVVQPLPDLPVSPVKVVPAPGEPTEYRDKALAAQGDVETLRALFAEVKTHHLDGEEVIDGTGDAVTLGDLIRRLGEEARK